jgi:hypothetical protein
MAKVIDSYRRGWDSDKALPANATHGGTLWELMDLEDGRYSIKRDGTFWIMCESFEQGQWYMDNFRRNS